MIADDAVVAEVCDACADLIEVRGLAQGREQLPTGEVCAVGAIHTVLGIASDWRIMVEASSRMRLRSLVIRAVEDHLRLPKWWFLSGLPRWNDKQGRREAEVVAAFRDTATALRAQSLVETPATTVAVFDSRWVFGAPEGAVRTVVEVVS